MIFMLTLPFFGAFRVRNRPSLLTFCLRQVEVCSLSPRVLNYKGMLTCPGQFRDKRNRAHMGLWRSGAILHGPPGGRF